MLQRRLVHRLLIFAGSITCGVVLFVVIHLVIRFSVDQTLASFDLREGHTLSIVLDKNIDVAHSLYCRMEGPRVSHSLAYVAAFAFEDKSPGFTLHSDSTARFYWVTPDTSAHEVLYIVDVQSANRWPTPDFGRYDTLTGNQLLDLAGARERGFALHNGMWIGIRGRNGQDRGASVSSSQ